MRIILISLLLFAGAASAQSPPSVDCDAIKNSTAPVELAYHAKDGTKTVVQVYRGPSGNDVVWSRQTLPSSRPTPPVLVAKASYVGGLIASAEMTTTFVGKYSHRTAKYMPDGLPRNFDHRSDLTYKVHAVITYGDDSVEETTGTVSYKFKSEETTAIGPCVLRVVHGESDTTNDAGRTRHHFRLYFPELRISATETDAEPVVDGLSAVFSEIKPAN